MSTEYEKQVLEYAKKLRNELLKPKEEKIKLDNAVTEQESKLLQSIKEDVDKKKEPIESVNMELEKERLEKKKAEERFKQAEEEKKLKEFLDAQMYGWTEEHKQLFRQLCSIADPKYLNMIDYSSERGKSVREILSKFTAIPLNYGQVTVSQAKRYVGYLGMNEIFVEYDSKNNKWILSGDYFKYTPRLISPRLEFDSNGTPIAITWTTYSDLLPNMPLKVKVQLTGIQ
ncbi:MAG: hypothetical protein ACPLKS_08030 [Caldisericum exile]|uniref:hypothetical protein n=1 Tax=Caldisericum exile TaxID=693075 RepID=UPI003C75ADF3